MTLQRFAVDKLDTVRVPNGRLVRHRGGGRHHRRCVPSGTGSRLSSASPATAAFEIAVTQPSEVTVGRRRSPLPVPPRRPRRTTRRRRRIQYHLTFDDRPLLCGTCARLRKQFTRRMSAHARQQHPGRDITNPAQSSDRAGAVWWSSGASIPGPHAFQACALPTELLDPLGSICQSTGMQPAYLLEQGRTKRSSGPDGTRTRDLRRDRPAVEPNCATGPRV